MRSPGRIRRSAAINSISRPVANVLAPASSSISARIAMLLRYRGIPSNSRWKRANRLSCCRDVDGTVGSSSPSVRAPTAERKALGRDRGARRPHAAADDASLAVRCSGPAGLASDRRNSRVPRWLVVGATTHWSAMASLVLPDEGEAYTQENSHPNLIIRASKQSAPLSSPRRCCVLERVSR